MLDWIFHFSISNPSFTLWVERFAFPIVSADPALSLIIVTMFLFLPDAFHSFRQKEKPLTDEEKLGLEPTQQPARGYLIKEAAKSFIGSFFFWLRLLSWLFIVIVFFYNFLPSPPSSWMCTHDLALFLGYWGVNIFVILVRLISIRVLAFFVIWPTLKNAFSHSERTAD